MILNAYLWAFATRLWKMGLNEIKNNIKAQIHSEILAIG